MRSVLKIHTRDKLGWIYIPTLILSSSFFINLIVSYLLIDKVNMYTGGASSILVYTFILGILVVAQTFPFSLGMSITRKDFFVGTSIMGTVSSIIIGILLYLLATIENKTIGWGSGMHFFHFPYLNEGTAVEQMIMYILLLLFLFFSGFIISSFSRRFGGKGILILALVSLLALSISSVFIHYFEAWSEIFHWFAKHTAVQLTYWLIPFIVFYWLCSFFLLRRATV